MVRVALKLLLIFALVFAGVKIWFGRLEERLRVPVAPPETVQAEPEVERTAIARKPDDYTIIVDRNIFQAVITKVEQEEPAPTPEELAATRLKLSLMGTIFGVERDSRAIIADDLKKQQDIYQVGDNIQGALIKSIERGRVVLQVNGTDEELLLKDREGGGPAYEPSPADFYQEPEPPPEAQPEPPPEAQTEPQVVEPAEPEGTTVPAGAEAIEPPVEPAEAESFEQQSLQESPVPTGQPVRPRPLRRPVRMPGPQQPGGVK
ncbi:MAG: type II secretion system protein N [Thermodesulfobacteriota bacterium]